jgi:hypothetical protein
VSRRFVGSLSFWAGLVAPLYISYVFRGAFTLFNKIYYLSKKKFTLIKKNIQIVILNEN